MPYIKGTPMTGLLLWTRYEACLCASMSFNTRSRGSSLRCSARGRVEGRVRPTPSRPLGVRSLCTPVVSAPICSDIVVSVKTNRPYLIATHGSAANRCLLAGSRWSWKTSDFFSFKEEFQRYQPKWINSTTLFCF